MSTINFASLVIVYQFDLHILDELDIAKAMLLNLSQTHTPSKLLFFE